MVNSKGFENANLFIVQVEKRFGAVFFTGRKSEHFYNKIDASLELKQARARLIQKSDVRHSSCDLPKEALKYMGISVKL